MTDPIAVQGLPPLAAHSLQPAAWLVLDLETGDAPQEAVSAVVESWKAPSNWKPETVEAKRNELAEKAAEKAALLDASPIVCLAFRTDRISVVLNGMDASSPEIQGWFCLPCMDERGLLFALRTLLNCIAGPDTTIAGHNIRGFDLPKLRNAYLRHRLSLPVALEPHDDVPLFDTMRMIKRYSMELADERYVSLDAVARTLGIPQPKQVITGADVPRLHQGGEYAAILTYCAIDVVTTERAYLLMTGQSAELN